MQVLYLKLSLCNPVHPSLRPGLGSPNSLPLCSQGAAGFSVHSEASAPPLDFFCLFWLPLYLQDKFSVFTPDSNSKRVKHSVDSETSLEDQENTGGLQQASQSQKAHLGCARPCESLTSLSPPPASICQHTGTGDSMQGMGGLCTSAGPWFRSLWGKMLSLC